MDTSAHGVAVLIFEQHIPFARARFFCPCCSGNYLILGLRNHHALRTGEPLIPSAAFPIPFDCAAGFLDKIVCQLCMIAPLVQWLDRDIAHSISQYRFPRLLNHRKRHGWENDMVMNVGHALGFGTGNVLPCDLLLSASCAQGTKKGGLVGFRLFECDRLIIIVQDNVIISCCKIGVQLPAQLVLCLTLIDPRLCLSGLSHVLLSMTVRSMYSWGIHFFGFYNLSSYDRPLDIHRLFPLVSCPVA